MNRDAVWQALQAQIRLVLPSLADRPLHEHERLVDLGANSIDRMEIVVQTLEALELVMPLAEAATAQRMGDLVTLMHARRQHA